jgi:hypothetical protein
MRVQLDVSYTSCGSIMFVHAERAPGVWQSILMVHVLG